MKNLIVIFGGKSTEHDISILSSMQVLENLDKSKYNIVPVYISKTGEWYMGEKLKNLETFKNFNEKGLKKVTILPTSDHIFVKTIVGYKKLFKVDCAFLVLHGMNGEDGTLQGLMELSNIPYTSCGVLASSVGMSKYMQKLVFTGLDIPVLPFCSLSKTEYTKLGKRFNLEKLAFPVVVKPDKLGSSIGISFCKNITQLKKALELAFKFDDLVVIEKAVTNMKEINISVLGDAENVFLSETEQPQTSHQILSFVDKYLSGGKNQKGGKLGKNQNFGIKNADFNQKNSKTSKKGMASLSRIIPADIDDSTLSKVQSIAKSIFTNLECKGVIRIDFIFDNDSQTLYVNEVNTIPGSLAFYLWESKGKSFKTELDEIIEIAIKTHKDKQNKVMAFESNVIK